MKITPTSFDHCLKKNAKVQISHTIDIIPSTGMILEFGVFQGKTITLIANRLPNRTIYGFDSFKGLPEDWVRNESSTYTKGHFKTRIPIVPKNVVLVKGFFDVSLPKWVQDNNPTKIALLHIDSDLYSSAMTVLRTLNHVIHPGTLIVFDELCDWSEFPTRPKHARKKKIMYHNWEEGEWKALQEWLTEFDREVVPISRTHSWSAVVKVVK